MVESNKSFRLCVGSINSSCRFVHLGAVAVKFGAASSTSVVPREGPI